MPERSTLAGHETETRARGQTAVAVCVDVHMIAGGEEEPTKVRWGGV